MARREALHLGGDMRIETGRDWNARYWIACRRGASMFFRDAKTLRRWLNLPLKTPSREAFDSWIASLEAADAQRKKAEPMDELRQASADVSGVELTDHVEPLTTEEPVQPTAPNLSQELLATGFGPEVFASDTEEDPTANTRVII